MKKLIFILSVTAFMILLTTSVSADIDSCQVLSLSNTIYNQNATITPTGSTHCININATNITFNGNGYSISNTTFNYSAIYSNQLNTTIKNCNIAVSNGTTGSLCNRGIGICLEGANNANIFNNSISFGRFGIYLYYTNNSNISMNSIYNQSASGMILNLGSSQNSIYNLISNNNLNHGIYILSSAYNNLSYSNFSNNIYSGIYLLTASYNFINQNNIYNNSIISATSLYLGNFSQYNNLVGNIISGSNWNALGISADKSINDFNASYNLIKDMQIIDTKAPYSDIWFSGHTQGTEYAVGNIFLNTTYTKESNLNCEGITINPNCNITRQWYFTLNVKNSSQNNISDANVSILDNYNNTVYNGVTDINGNIDINNLTEYIRQAYNGGYGIGSYYYYTPHSIIVSKSGYTTNSTIINLTTTTNVNHIVTLLEEIINTTYPLFSTYYDNNASLLGSGIGIFNVTIENTNGTVWLSINGTNITAKNLTSNVYNASYSFTSNGTYSYQWYAYGNGTSNNLNNSNIRYYFVNETGNNRYWVGGNGTWNTTDTSHWSLTSGGAGGAPVPTSSDNVFIDSNSGLNNGIINVTSKSSSFSTCKNLTSVSGYNYTIDMNRITVIDVSASMILEQGLTIQQHSILNSDVGAIYFTSSNNNSNIINQNGANFDNVYLYFPQSNVSTHWILMNNLITTRWTNANTSNAWLDFKGGIFDANNYNITADAYNINILANGNNTINMGSGVWTVTGNDNVSGTGLTWSITSSNITYNINSQTSTLIFNDATKNSKTLNFSSLNTSYNGQQFNNVIFLGNGTYNIYGSNIFNTLNITNGLTLSFQNGTTQNITNFNAVGTAGNYITLNGLDNKTFTLSKSSGVVNADYLNISNSNATGGATWYAGSHSIDSGGNSGWIFNTTSPIVETTSQTGGTVENDGNYHAQNETELINQIYPINQTNKSKTTSEPIDPKNAIAIVILVSLSLFAVLKYFRKV